MNKYSKKLIFKKDGQLLELTHVCDLRLGKQPNVIFNLCFR